MTSESLGSTNARLPASTGRVVIVGAGLAGLNCARELVRVGLEPVVVEASDGVGGRVRSDRVDGFTLDRGFQVYLDAYPEGRRALDLAALELQAFHPGALVRHGGRTWTVADPRRRPQDAVASLRAPVASTADAARLALLRRRVLAASGAELLAGEDISTLDLLADAGFSAAMVERFWRPLFGGAQLDPSLGTSRRAFELVLRSFFSGNATVPAAGMGAIPEQLAAGLPTGTVRLHHPVAGVDDQGVTLVGGRHLAADTVVVATEAPAAARLLGLTAPRSRPAACVYFTAESDPFEGPWILLDGDGRGPAANVAVMTNVTPSYGPPGGHLIAAAVVGSAALPDMAEQVRAQLRSWFGPPVDRWRELRTYRIVHGQPDQRPPFAPRQAVRLGPGRFVCGDHRDTASIQGALYSGRRTAEAVATEIGG